MNKYFWPCLLLFVYLHQDGFYLSSTNSRTWSRCFLTESVVFDSVVAWTTSKVFVSPPLSVSWKDIVGRHLPFWNVSWATLCPGPTGFSSLTMTRSLGESRKLDFFVPLADFSQSFTIHAILSCGAACPGCGSCCVAMTRMKLWV